MNASLEIPLSNPSCEKSIIGAVILKPELWAIVGDAFPLPDPDEPLFAEPANQTIFDAMIKIHQRGANPDLTLIAQELADTHLIDTVGGSAYLAECVDWVYSTFQLPEYCRIVLEKWKRRKAMKAAQRVAHEAAERKAAPEEVLRLFEKTMSELNFDDDKPQFVSVGESIHAELVEMDAIRSRQIERIGFKTGFDELDRLICGFRPGNLVIVAARPSVGKTALAMNIAANLSLRQGVPVAFQSLEMGRMGELNGRILAQESGVSLSAIMEPRKLGVMQWEQIQDAREFVAGKPLFIDDASGLKLGDVRRRARLIKRKYPALGVYLVDYLQLLHGDARQYQRKDLEISEISGGLKELAKELQITVIALSQLSRRSEQRDKADRVPQLSDLRESGAIEQDADVVIMLHTPTPQKENRDKKAEEKWIESHRWVYVRKNRNGPCGRALLGYTPHLTRFHEESGRAA